MTETYIRLRCDKVPDTVKVDSEHLLDGFYRALDCECIETVHLAGGYLMIIDESGKLKQKRSNPMANKLYSLRETVDWIAGDALLARIGSRNGESDIVPLKDAEMNPTIQTARIVWERIQRRAGKEINKEKGEQANGNHSDGL